MNARDLIAALEKAPPEATVWIDTEGGWRCDIEAVVRDSDINDDTAVVITSSVDPNYTGFDLFAGVAGDV